MSSSLWLSNDPTQSEEQSKVLEREIERGEVNSFFDARVVQG
jgi:hypothetical protein